jgi:hypothetical protein
VSVVGLALLLALIAAGYVLLSGAAFVSVYWWPDHAPKQFYARLFAPLDVVARQFTWFGRFYNAFHSWCYRVFVRSEEEA